MLSALLNKTFPIPNCRLIFICIRYTYRAGRSSEVRAFAHGAMSCRIDPSWGGPIELFLVPASALRLV